MNDNLRVRVYNVRFGDAILISVPDRVPGGGTETRHILVDVGNVLGGKGGEDSVFKPVVEDILKVLDGEPLDLYVMTHEHLDHIQGLYYVSTRLGLDLKVKRAWLTASAAENYYEGHPEARKKRSLALAALDVVQSYFSAAGEKPNAFVQAMLLNNNPRSSSQCVDYLRKLAAETVYVHREADPGPLPFQEPGTKIDIWGPEEDTSIYYGAFRPAALGVTAGAAGARAAATTPNPPAGVDAGAFYDLVEFRRRGYGDNLLAIDAAANNSSVVFCLEWRGWRLLFPGDAEQRAWKEMDRREARARALPQGGPPRQRQRHTAPGAAGQDPARNPARQPPSLGRGLHLRRLLQRRPPLRNHDPAARPLRPALGGGPAGQRIFHGF